MMLPKINSEVVKEKIVNFIREIVNESDTDGIVIGLSGGIDSTVVAFLLKEAIGNDKIIIYIVQPPQKKILSMLDLFLKYWILIIKKLI